LARAADNYGVPVTSLEQRIKATLQKHLLRDEPDSSPAVITEFADKLQADDLCLIVACEQGNQKAWDDLVERFTPTVRSAARAASSNEEAAEDLAQSIWAELHGLRRDVDGQPIGKLAYYSGRGSLAGWLRAVVSQLAIDQHRKQSRLVQTEEDADFDRMVQSSTQHDRSGREAVVNPEDETSRKFAAAEMQKALSDAVRELAAEDRLLVKLYYFDGLRLKEAGAVLGVHEATASRRLTRVHAELRRHVEGILMNDKGWTKSETDEAFSNLAVGLETDIEPLLAADNILTKKENEIAG
jgi:RNA polymerase sigma-70 factor (ECF subfamily)